MKKILLLHGWFCTPESDWYPYILSEGKKLGYEVTVPFLKDNNEPTLESWTKCALENFQLDAETTIIGHSLGAILGLKILQESKVQIDKLITVAGWDYWDLTPEHGSFFTTPVNHSKVIENTKTRHVFHSDTDPYVTPAIAEEYAKRINAKFILIKGAGHFQTADGRTEMPEILDILK